MGDVFGESPRHDHGETAEAGRVLLLVRHNQPPVSGELDERVVQLNGPQVRAQLVHEGQVETIELLRTQFESRSGRSLQVHRQAEGQPWRGFHALGL